MKYKQHIVHVRNSVSLLLRVPLKRKSPTTTKMLPLFVRDFSNFKHFYCQNLFVIVMNLKKLYNGKSRLKNCNKRNVGISDAFSILLFTELVAFILFTIFPHLRILFDLQRDHLFIPELIQKTLNLIFAYLITTFLISFFNDMSKYYDSIY